MGTINLRLPPELSAETVRELERACVIGGPDNMPWPSRVRIDGSQMSVRREVDESGCLAAPWLVNGAGRLMTASATLMERDPAYLLLVELARGKANQLRCQASEWQAGGLQLSPPLARQVHDVSVAFGHAAVQPAPQEAIKLAQQALQAGCQAGDQLVQAYVQQVFQLRHQRQAKFDSALACRLGQQKPQGRAAELLGGSFNTTCLPLPWKEIEPTEASYNWDNHDAMLDWIDGQELNVVAGPLIDFAPNRLPDWLGSWERDLHSIASFMCDYVETTVRRYHDRIRCWQLTAGSNSAHVLSLTEDELLWLTVRLAEAARQIDSGLELTVGIAQPWGDYMATEEHTHSPFIFADTLIRAGLNLAAIDVEWLMGISPYGSYARDLLEASRLLDLYALLGVPLQVTLGYPSSSEDDPGAEPALRVDAGHWHGGFSPATQAEWAEAFASLALCKPYVRGTSWVQATDADPHQYPNCGLFNAAGEPKPIVATLRKLREQHLK